jgi:hypothetical protein
MRAGCAVSVAFAAGSLRTSFAWASRSAGVSATAIAATANAIGFLRRERIRTLENGLQHMPGANTPGREAR